MRASARAREGGPYSTIQVPAGVGVRREPDVRVRPFVWRTQHVA